MGDPGLGLPHAPTLLADALDEDHLLALGAQAEQGFRVPGADLFALNAIGDGLGQLEQSHHVGDRAAIDLETFCQVLLGASVLGQIPLEGHRLFDGVEVLALEVFDDRKFGDQAIVGFADLGSDGL